jgi:hypothetical protein
LQVAAALHDSPSNGSSTGHTPAEPASQRPPPHSHAPSLQSQTPQPLGEGHSYAELHPGRGGHGGLPPLPDMPPLLPVVLPLLPPLPAPLLPPIPPPPLEPLTPPLEPPLPPSLLVPPAGWIESEEPPPQATARMKEALRRRATVFMVGGLVASLVPDSIIINQPYGPKMGLPSWAKADLEIR